MVDGSDSFLSNPELMSAGVEQIKRMLIAQRHMWVVDAIEAYKRVEAGSGYNVDTSVIKSRVFSLFLELQSGLRRVLSDAEFSFLSSQVESKEFDEIYAAFIMMDSFLDSTGLMEWGQLVPQADDLFAGVDDDLF